MTRARDRCRPRAARRGEAPALSRLAFAVLCTLGAGAAANPNGPTVAAGQASMAVSGKTLTVTNTPGTIINWRGFSIAPDELTRFIQESAHSTVLNRVVGLDPSLVLGQLQSNGRVYLINPNGIVFGRDARVDVGGLLASTLDLRDADFLAGRLRFDGPASAGALRQLGSIRTPSGGEVLLIAPTLENDGIVTSPQGEILLAAGRSVQLVDAANPALRVTLGAKPGEVVNLGKLLASGGRIGIHAGLVAQGGTVDADRAERGPAGEIYLKGSAGVTLAPQSVTTASGADGGRITIQAEAGEVSVSGSLAARGEAGSGGTIRVLGPRIALDRTTLDASGSGGGGTVLVGGDAHGAAVRDGAVEYANAGTTSVGADARIRADAEGAGNGGKVVVWADGSTQFRGSISARGGAAGGDGGFVETSGKGGLDYAGSVDTRAPRGATGTLLLDPTDITISSAASTGTLGFGGGCGANTYCDTTATPSNLNVTTLITQLGTSNVTVSTASALGGNGDITVNNGITYTSANSLSLLASRNITFNAGLANIGAGATGAITLTGGGAGSISLKGISSNGGNITVSSGSGGVTVATGSGWDLSASRLSIDAGGGPVNLNNAIIFSNNATASAAAITNATSLVLGSFTLNAGGTLTVNHSGAGSQTASTTLAGSGNIVKQGSGTLTLSNANTYTGTTSIQAGTVVVTVNNALGTAAGGTTVSSGATLALSSSGPAGNYATAEPVTINGSGDAGNGRAGAIDNITGTNSFAWPITLGSASQIGATAGTATASGTIAGAGNALTFAGAGNATASGVISGAATTLTKNGSGTLTLSNVANTFGGAVTLNNGTTSVAALATAGTNSSLGTGAVTPGIAVGSASAATLSYTGATTSTDRAVTVGGAGGATLQATTAAATLTLSGGIAGGGNPLTFASAGSITESGVISGAGTTLTMNGTNLLTLSNVANTFSGAVTLNSGTTWAAMVADAGTNSSFGTGGVTPGISLGSGATTGAIAYNPAGSPSSNRVITLNGPGNIRNITAGQTVTLTGGIVGNGNALTIGPGGSGNIAISGVISGNGTTLTDSQFANTALLTLSGINTYTGATTINTGTTIISQDANLGTAPGAPTAGALAFGGGILRNTATATLSSNRGVQLNAGGGSISTDPATTLTVGGIVAGTGALTKLGTGTLALSGNNTYSGLTTVSAGTVDLQSNTALGTTAGATTVGNGTSVQIDGSGLVIAEPITLSGAGPVGWGAVGALRNLANNNTWTGAVTLAAGGARINSDAGTLTLSNTATIGGAAQPLTVGGAGNTTLNGVIGTTTGTLTKDGAGMLTLGAAETFTGATTLTLGTLQFAGAGALAASDAVTLANTAGVTLDLNGTAQTIGSLAGGGAAGGVVTSSVAGAASLTTGSAASTTFSGIVQDGSGTVALVKQGAATTFTLAGANAYSGGTTIKAGAVVGTSAAANAFGSGSVTLGDSAGGANAATLQVGTTGLTYANPIVLASTTTGTLTLGNTGAAISTTFSGGVTGSNDLTIASNATTGTVTLATAAVNNAGSVTHTGAGTGAATISAAVGSNVTGLTQNSTTSAFNISGAISVNAAGTTLANASGTALLTASGGVTGTGALVLANNSATAGGVTLSGAAVNPTGSITNSGTGSGGTTVSASIGASVTGVSQSSATSSLTLSGTNTYAGTTSVNAGTLVAAGGSAIPDAGAVVVANAAGATLNLGASETIGRLSGGGASGGAVALNANTLTTGDAAATTFSGVIGGSGGLVKQGSGAFTLAGANTYTGTTTVSAGTLVAADAAALGGVAGATTVSGGATLQIANVAVGAEPVTLSGSGVGAAGALIGTGTATLGGAVTLAAASTIAASAASDSLTLGGALNGAFVLTQAGAGSVRYSGAVGATTPLAAFVSNAGSTTDVHGGLLRTSGTQTYGGALVLSAAATLQTANADIVAGGAVTATAGTLTLATGSGNATLTNPANDFGTVTVSSAGAVSLVDANALALGASSLATLRAQTLSGDLSVNGTIAASGAGNAIVLAAGGNFVNAVGAGALAAPAGNWQVWSTDPSADTRGGLVYAYKQYNATYGVTAVAGSGNGLLYRIAPSLVPGLAGGVSKTYDGTTAAGLAPANYTVSGAIDGDTVVVGGGSAAYDTRNVGSAKVVTASGIGISSASNGAAPVYGYSLASTAAAAPIGSITAAALTLGASADSKVYDGTTASAAAPVVVSGLMTGDSVTGLAQAFDSRNAGVRSLAITGYTLNDGNGGGNYSVTTNAAAGSIAKATLVLGAVTDNKTYDRTTASSATPTVVSGLASGDSVSGLAQAFDSRNAGSRTLAITGYTLNDGNAGGNYNVTANTAAGTIAKAALVLGAVGDAKTYDGSTTSSSTPVVVSGLVAGDSVSGLAQAFDSRNAGSRTLGVSGYAVNDGNAGGNYTVSSNTAAGTISKAALVLGAVGDTKTYDGSTASSATPVVVSGLVAGDSVSGLAQAFDSRNAGSRTLAIAAYTLNDGNAGGNYTVSSNTAAGTIAKAALVLGAVGDAKTYDGSTASSPTPVVVSGLVAGDSVSALTQGFDSRNAGARTLAVTGYTVADGNAGGNYSVTTNTAAGTISKAALVLGAVGDTKTYDGSTASSATPVVVSGLVAGDSVSGLAQAFDSRNAGSRTLGVTGYSVADGNAGGNYTVSSNTAAGTISKAALVLGAVGDTKTYDGTTTSSATPVVVSGLVAGDSVSGLAQAFDSRNAGSRTLGVTGYTVADGNAGGNYNVTTSTAAGTISKAALVLGAVGDTKTYDGTTASSATPLVVSGLAAGDSVSALTQAFDSRNAGSRTLGVSGYAVNDGNAGGNYTVSSNTAAGTIAKAALVLGAVGDTKTYDGSTASSATPVVVSGLVAGDSVSGLAQAFDSRNAGSRTLGVTGYTLADGNAGGNYNVTTSTAAGTISKAALVLAAVADTKTYDGTTGSSASPGVASGLVAGDSVSGLAQAFDSRNTGSRTLGVSGYTVNDGNGGANYNVTATSAAGTISKATLVLGATGDAKTYDGTAASSASPTVVSGLVAGDSVSALSQSFDSRSAGARTLSIAGYTLNDGNAGGNYNVTANTAAGTIAKAALVLGAVADSKTYDGAATSSAAPVVVSGLVAGDSVSGLTQAFDSRNAGSRTLGVTGYAVNDGNAGGNYTVSSNTAAGTIAKAALVLGAVGDAKTYDGSTTSSATPVVVSGLVAGDSVSGLAQAFDSRNAGSRTLGVTGYAVNDGNAGGNYTVSSNTAAGTISKAALVLGAVGDSKTYDGTTASIATPVVVSGLVAGDSVGGLAQAFDSRNAGNRTLGVTGYAVADGNGGGNYAVSSNTAAGTIAKAALVLGAVGDAKTYDGSTASSSTPVVVSGLVAGDSVSGLAQAFDSRNAGNRTLGITGYAVADGNGGGNYTVSSNTAAGTIAKAALVLGAAGDAKTYDGTTNSGATPTVVSGLVAGDSVSSLAQAFDSRNAGSRTLAVTGYAVNDGNAGGNYNVTATSAAGTISKATLVLTAVGDAKTYDGTAASSASPTVVSGLVAGDSVSALSQSFDSRNAGARTLSIAGYTLNDGNGGGNYNVTANSAAGTIAKAALVLGAVADSKTYDGSTASGATPVVVSGLIAGDSVSGLAQAFDSRNAGSRTLGVTGFAVADGNAGGNYNVTSSTAVGTIAKAALVLGAVGDAKTYDGSTASSATPIVVSGLVAGDGVNGLVQAFDSRNAGSRTLGVTGYAIADGNAGGNYTVTANTAAGTIAKAALVLGAAGDAKTYDGTTISGATPTVVSGLVAGDSVSGLVQAFDSRNAGSRTLAVTGYAVNDGNAGGNYSVSTSTAAGTIAKAALVLGATGDAKTYDGTVASNAVPIVVSGLVAGDSVSGLAQAFDSRNAGARTLALIGYSVSDANGGANYTVGTRTASGSIAPAPLVLGAAPDSKVYDGGVGSTAAPRVVSGLVGNDTVTTLTQTYDAASAGPRTLGVSGYNVNDGNAGANYRVTLQSAPGSIAPAPLRVSADDKARSEGQPNPPLTASFSGFVAGESPLVLTGTLSLGTTAALDSAPGSYPIVASGLGATNYAISFVDGALRVARSVSAPRAPTPALAERDGTVGLSFGAGVACVPRTGAALAGEGRAWLDALAGCSAERGQGANP